jgi:hypothetical protein
MTLLLPLLMKKPAQQLDALNQLIMIEKYKHGTLILAVLFAK